ncbi:hypothetical protein QYE77_01210 [Thermanaerothrix sp. 4228-RoL]|uniref:Uncharacterized protein n=1 Tax=Thermanaerothrix solaris TaxID=3058434 RepID=A0ABU3NJ34_9CHLR|nr:hypothetical protein [Thermanaerothrix sp. 4228-RoL]MDT8896869.1 hypothetical protein [Thermanaerothrix sp. 4228-RoL]
MFHSFLQRIEIAWWDFFIASLTHITPLQQILRYLYRLWKRYSLDMYLKFLLLAAVGGFLTGMIIAQFTVR